MLYIYVPIYVIFVVERSLRVAFVSFFYIYRLVFYNCSYDEYCCHEMKLIFYDIISELNS